MYTSTQAKNKHRRTGRHNPRHAHRRRQTLRHVYDTQTGRQTHKTHESLLAKQWQCYRIQCTIHNTINKLHCLYVSFNNRCIIKDTSTIYRSKEAQPLKECMIIPLDCMPVFPISRRQSNISVLSITSVYLELWSQQSFERMQLTMLRYWPDIFVLLLLLFFFFYLQSFHVVTLDWSYNSRASNMYQQVATKEIDI